MCQSITMSSAALMAGPTAEYPQRLGVRVEGMAPSKLGSHVPTWEKEHSLWAQSHCRAEEGLASEARTPLEAPLPCWELEAPPEHSPAWLLRERVQAMAGGRSTSRVCPGPGLGPSRAAGSSEGSKLVREGSPESP